MALEHADSVPSKPRPKQEFAHCRFCTKILQLNPERLPKPRRIHQGNIAEDVCCFRCLHKISCVLCGRELIGRHLDRHQDGTKCPEEAVEHVLLKAGWQRPGTLSKSLKSRGFSVRYVPRWVGLPGLIETPVSHHSELWKHPASLVPEPPPWPEAELREAVERLERLAALQVLKG
jgi:hypothetical protein